MENYLKNFDKHSDYETFTQSSDFIRPNVSICIAEKDVHYNPKDYSKKYLTFRALEDGTFSLGFSTNDLQYSIDYGTTWITLTAGTNTPTVTKGNKILWKASGLTPTSSVGIGTFSSTGKFDVEGNIMSLVEGDNFVGITTMSDYQFRFLFDGCTNLVNAKHLILPATTLAEECYDSMFRNCTSLTTAPELPATTLVTYCYGSMFEGCTSLTTAPELPAMTLGNYCYQYMFKGCTSLTTTPVLPSTTLAKYCYSGMFFKCTSLIIAPELLAITLASNCYDNMFNGCTSLTTAPELPATTLVDSCYYRMFQNCSSLTTAPVLPATTLVNSCYSYMFRDCTNLSKITCLATDISADECTKYWVSNVASTGTFTKAASMTWPTGAQGIPTGWTVQTASN